MAIALLKSQWSSGNLSFLQRSSSGDATINFGEDDTGVNVNLYGATSGVVLYWDQSADLLVASGHQMKFTGSLGAAGVLDLDGAASYFLDIEANGDGGLVLTADGMSQDPETASEDGFLRLLIGASKYEIPIYLNT